MAVRAGTRFYEAQARHQLALAILSAPDAADKRAARTELDQTISIVEGLGIRAYARHIHLGRAQLAQAVGDDAGYEGELRRAYGLFVDVRADGHARRLEAELSARSRR